MTRRSRAEIAFLVAWSLACGSPGGMLQDTPPPTPPALAEWYFPSGFTERLSSSDLDALPPPPNSVHFDGFGHVDVGWESDLDSVRCDVEQVSAASIVLRCDGREVTARWEVGEGRAVRTDILRVVPGAPDGLPDMTLVPSDASYDDLVAQRRAAPASRSAGVDGTWRGGLRTVQIRAFGTSVAVDDRTFAAESIVCSVSGLPEPATPDVCLRTDEPVATPLAFVKVGDALYEGRIAGEDGEQWNTVVVSDPTRLERTP